ncbi:STAS domain-containing protein [Streptomyces mexicanus]|uniref:STAS domain-containing protein n=1 Tax=Streptomyces mexicanus TaxID=178566 RepID=UPI0031EB994C
MSQDPALSFQLQHADGLFAVAAVTGDLDFFTSPGLHSPATALIAAGHPHLILDLSGVAFCDSAGLSALIRLWKATDAAGGSLTLAAVTAPVLRAITVTGLDSLLTITPTTSQALEQHSART